MIISEDGDLVQICLLNQGSILTEDNSENIGKLFVKMSKQDLTINESIISEEYINCNELATSVMNHVGLSSIPLKQRVPSVVLLMIILGGDTTSYLYLPYVKSLTWYSEHADFVGSLVTEHVNESEQDLTECEVQFNQIQSQFACLKIDVSAAKKLMILLYCLRNPKVVPRWNQYPHPEQTGKLKELTYLYVQKIVARSNIPKVFRYMMSIPNLVEHLKRCLLRFFTWSYARIDIVPDVPLIGFIYSLVKKVNIEESIELNSPTYSDIEQRSAEYRVIMVKPSIIEKNTTHTELFGKDGPSVDDILAGARNAASRTTSISVSQLRDLKAAHHRLTKEAHNEPTMAMKRVILIRYHNQKEGVTKEDMKTLRQRMGKTKASIDIVYDEVIKSLTTPTDSNSNTISLDLPWVQMGLEDEIPTITNEGEDGDGGDGRGGESGDDVYVDDDDDDDDDSDALDNMMQQQLAENPEEAARILNQMEENDLEYTEEMADNIHEEITNEQCDGVVDFGVTDS
jgi:hypothetical protein